MFAQNWIEAVNIIFGTNTVTTAIMIASGILIIVDLISMFSLKGNRYLIQIILILDFLGSLLFTFVGWFPQLIGVVMAFIFALFGAWLFTKG